MISQAVFARVFHVRCGSRQGTAFLGTYGGREYLISAEHIVQEFSRITPLFLERDDGWVEWPLRLVGKGSDILQKLDVAVFEVLTDFEMQSPLSLNTSSAFVSQEMFFVGFPFGMVSVRQMMDGWPVALVKKALLSGFDNDVRVWLLDGINNAGFSGGPVIYKSSGSANVYVGAVIAAYRKEFLPVKTTDNWFRETEFLSEANSGLIYAISTSVVRALIDADRSASACS